MFGYAYEMLVAHDVVACDVPSCVGHVVCGADAVAVLGGVCPEDGALGARTVIEATVAHVGVLLYIA